MQLIKDFKDGRIVFFWEEEGNQVSEDMPTFIEAKDWWVLRCFKEYDGPERRKSIYDRRLNEDKRNRAISESYQPSGRRKADKPVAVTDRSTDTLRDLGLLR